jgi:hypothetical protein
MKHGWIITKDNIDGGLYVGTRGPRNATASADEIKASGQRFRLRDDDGEIYYYGKAITPDDGDGFEPLDHFGTPLAGCTTIEYFERGGWRIL